MLKRQPHGPQAQAGFTLVELAIVMIIIGLLIGGVLKGQALITNAQITATVAQIKSIDAATTSFRDQYTATPGDMTAANATARLPNCNAAPCNNPGDGDGRVDNAGAAITFANPPAGEQLAFWAHLNVAGLLSGVAPSAAAVPGPWGANHPASRIAGGGFDVGYWTGGALMNSQLISGAQANTVAPGTYLALHGTPTTGVTAVAADTFLTPQLAERFDTKIDDGVPGTGTVLAAGNATCTAASATGGTYAEALQGNLCSLYIKFQN